MEHELVQTLATVQEVAAAKWDSLGQAIAVAVRLGPDAGPTGRCWVTLKPAAAQRLLRELQRVLAETPGEGWTRQ